MSASVHSFLLLGRGLAGLVRLLLRIAQGAPHLTQLLADAPECQVGIVLLDLFAVFLAEQHEPGEGLLLLTGGLLRL